MAAACAIDIRVLGPKASDSKYSVEARLDNGAQFSGHKLRLDEDAMTQLLLEEGEIAAYGVRLGNLLLGGPIRDAFLQALGAGLAQDSIIRIRLSIDSNAAELHAIAWERIFVQTNGRPSPIACSSNVPFSRYTSLPIPEPKPVRERPIRMHVAVSNPVDLPPGLVAINVEEEIRSLVQSLDQVEDVRITIQPGRTGLSADFQAELAQRGYRIVAEPVTGESLARHAGRQQAHIVHFLGHGFYKNGVSALFLEKEDGRVHVATDTEFVPFLANLKPLPQLVFLAACESAMRAEGEPHPFVGIGPKLVEAGVPAVIAMQAKVPVALATRLTAQFYSKLLIDGQIDIALNEARGLLFSQGHANWSIPVLFMRLAEGRLFEADPVRVAIRRIATGNAFVPPSHIPPEPLPLEGVVLKDSLINEQWEQTVAQAQSKVDVRTFLFAELDLKQTPARIVVSGERGMAKSGAVLSLTKKTAENSLGDGAPCVLPLYVDLQRYPGVRPRSFDVSQLEALIRESLETFWPDTLTEPGLLRLLIGQTPTLRIVLDNGDDLPSAHRNDIVEKFRELSRRYPQHEYVFAMEHGCWNPLDIDPTAIVAIRAMSQTGVERYLRRMKTKWAAELSDALAATQLYDLASLPWLLIRMMVQARRGSYPSRRAQVLRDLIEADIRKIPTERGQQSRALQSLYALARRMHSARVWNLPAAEVFSILDEVRGNREYNLEELLDSLIDHGLLKRQWNESIGFAYPAYQAYCCARALSNPAEEPNWEEITATVGQMSHLRWWEDALTLLSGVLENPTPLLELIAHGATLREGDRLFLAARCVQEAGLASETTGVAGEVLDALLWRTDTANERSAYKRLRVVRVLGQFRNPAVLPYLARIASERVRPTYSGGQGDKDFEYGQIRQAAGRALRRLMPVFEAEIEREDAKLAAVLRLWRDENVAELARILTAKDGDSDYGPALRGIAGFALADLPGQFESAQNELVSAFLRIDTDTNTLWAITDALILLDPAFVLEKAVLPLLDENASDLKQRLPDVWQHRSDWDSPLVYLIGQIRASHPKAREFVEGFLRNPRASHEIQGRAIAALGSMAATDWRERLERIAMGDLSDLAGGPGRTASQREYIRRKALEALALVGTRETLDKLRANRAGWTPDFERTFHATSEEIHWRTRNTSAPGRR